MKRWHAVIAGDPELCAKAATEAALTLHTAAYTADTSRRTRITVLCDSLQQVNDYVFEYQELFDNSYWRTVDLTGDKVQTILRRPQYEGLRKDFIDVEWEFVIGRLSDPVLQRKLRRWAADTGQRLSISLCYSDTTRNDSYAEKMRRRLPSTVSFEIYDPDPAKEASHMDSLTAMARYVNYIYQTAYQSKQVPTELPEDEVCEAWDKLDERMKTSNMCNVMSIPVKMEILGHDRNDWDTFYALTADEIELLTAVEHNRWSVERLIQGSRPCTDEEKAEIDRDMQLRLSDAEYARTNPVSLKKKYKVERNAHYDLCAFSELGVDETGLPVTRYDRDLTAAIPLIVKTYNDRHANG